MLRSHQKVHTATGEGEITSGTFSPTLGASIGFARLPVGVNAGDQVEVEIRDKRLAARVVKPPFVRHGKRLVMTTSESAMNVPAELKYTESHEWIRAESDGTLTIGITDHAQEALGDLVFIELPPVGRKVAAGEACAVVESVKAASDIYAPVAGEVVAANDEVVDAPEKVNADAYAQLVLPAEACERRRCREASRRCGVHEARCRRLRGAR